MNIGMDSLRNSNLECLAKKNVAPSIKMLSLYIIKSSFPYMRLFNELHFQKTSYFWVDYSKVNFGADEKMSLELFYKKMLGSISLDAMHKNALFGKSKAMLPYGFRHWCNQ